MKPTLVRPARPALLVLIALALLAPAAHVADAAQPAAPASPAAPAAPAAPAGGAAPAATATPPAPQPIEFEEETLDNGLRVIYAPLRQAPVVHARVIYHVGSKDERPDRQGFAHLFEHMMFRGSAHVKPEQHMRLVGTVGGNSNAFTSFDQTVYVNTVPKEHLDMVLYLEADRMASFKVDENIYKTERKVVAEEWRIRQNRPYGTLYENFLKSAFTAHSYRWTPIGVMEHLQAAEVAELQDFFNTYYLPNNAILVIAGDIDVAKTKEMVRRYFGWIPPGPKVQRDIPKEPEQAEPRRVETPDRVPLPAVMIGYKLPDYRSDDHYALTLLGTILSGGRSARRDRELVYGPSPLAVQVSAGPMQLEDAGVFTASATAMQGRDPKAIEQFLVDAIAKVAESGVSDDELAMAKTQARVTLINGRKTAEDLAGQLGEEALFGHDAKRVNEMAAKFDAVTAADVQAVAKKYLQPARAPTLHVMPDPTGAETPQGAAAATDAGAKARRAPRPPIAPPARRGCRDRQRRAGRGAPGRDARREVPRRLAEGAVDGHGQGGRGVREGHGVQGRRAQVIVMPDPRCRL